MEKATKEKIYAGLAGLTIALASYILDHRSAKRVDSVAKTTIAVIEAQNVFRDSERKEIKEKVDKRGEIIQEYQRWVGEKDSKDAEHDRRLDRLDSRVDNVERGIR